MAAQLPRQLLRDSLPVAARELSATAAFFHAYPRLFGGQTEFATSDAYRIGIYRLGIPYLATGLVLVVAALIANFYFLARKSVIPGADDTRDSDPNQRDCTGKAFLPFSCFLNLAIIFCISLAFASCFAMRSAADNASDVLDAAKANISLHVRDPGYTLQTFAVQAEKVDNATVDENVTKVIQLFKEGKSYFVNMVSKSVEWFGHLDAIRNEIGRMSTRYITFTVLVMLSCIVGQFLTFVCDVTTPASRRIKIIAFSLLLIPLAATWAHIAISTWIAVATADFCHSLDQYHQAVLVQASGDTAEISPSNLFLQYKLQCPAQTNVAEDLSGASKFLESAHPDNFSDGLDVVTNKQVSVKQWMEGREWMQDRILEYQQCQTQVAMAAKLSYYMCGDHGASGISAVSQLWLCSFGLSLLFTAVVAILSCGHPPSEFCSGRELMCVYGAPELISAFGDIRSVLRRHSTFRRMESGKFRMSDVSPTSSDLDVMEQVARYYNFDDDSEMSTTRPRRNAQSSPPFSSQNSKRSDLSLDHFGGEPDDGSTDSSRFS